MGAETDPTDEQLESWWDTPYSQWAKGKERRVVASGQAFVAGFEYSLGGASHAPRKGRPMHNILTQCIDIIANRNQHSIQCIEAALIGVYVTQGLPNSSLTRFGISFESKPNNPDGGGDSIDAAGRDRYYHIVLGVAAAVDGGRSRKFGAIGISRSPVLGSRPVVYPDLYSLIRSYDIAYRKAGHTLLTAKIGRALPQGPCVKLQRTIAMSNEGDDAIPYFLSIDGNCVGSIPNGERLTFIMKQEASMKVGWQDKEVWVRAKHTSTGLPTNQRPEDPEAYLRSELALAASARFESLSSCSETPVWYGEHFNIGQPGWKAALMKFQVKLLSARTFWGYSKGCEPYRRDDEDEEGGGRSRSITAPSPRARRRRSRKALHPRQAFRWQGTQMPDVSTLGQPPGDGSTDCIDEFVCRLRRLPLSDPYSCLLRVWSGIAFYSPCCRSCGHCGS